MKLTDYAGKGLEEVTDVSTPYLKLAQTISAECNKNKPEYIPGLEAGMFFCSATKKVYGATVEVIVLATRKSYVLVDDDGQYKGREMSYQPTWQRDVAGAIRTPEGFKAQLNYDYLVVAKDDVAKDPDAVKTPMVYSLKRSDVGAAIAWNTALKQLRLPEGQPCPLFGGVWKLTSCFRESKKGSWYSVSTGKGSNIVNSGFIDDAIVDSVAQASTSLLEQAKQNVPALLENNAEDDI